MKSEINKFADIAGIRAAGVLVSLGLAPVNVTKISDCVFFSTEVQDRHGNVLSDEHLTLGYDLKGNNFLYSPTGLSKDLKKFSINKEVKFKGVIAEKLGLANIFEKNRQFTPPAKIKTPDINGEDRYG